MDDMLRYYVMDHMTRASGFLFRSHFELLVLDHTNNTTRFLSCPPHDSPDYYHRLTQITFARDAPTRCC